ncbi:MAG TPA: FHIPEP family type III secretion protein [Candidatus Xenobia bacterium]|jgi:flagellar biosynthesis protein FlhA
MSRFSKVSQTVMLLTDGISDTVSLLPWSLGEQGARTYFKLEREGEAVLLDGGAYPALPVELHKNLMRLVNEGWAVQGEVHITFDGMSHGDQDPLVDTDAVTLQIGRRLLPLLDPQLGSPLLDRLRHVREELAADLGFVLPGVRVTDNLTLPENGYALCLRQIPVVAGEVFLDRLLAVGSLAQLGQVQGWSTQEPAFRVTAKWIEADEREKAEQSGCLVVGALNVLMTHVQEVLRTHAAELLGLQDLRNLLGRLSLSHPVVVDEFVRDTRALRFLRKVLHQLLMERVSIRNLISILEVVGDAWCEEMSVEAAVEETRSLLVRQILQTAADDEGNVAAVVLSDELEERMLASPGRPDDLLRHVKQQWEEQGSPRILFCQPNLRRPLRDWMATSLPGVAVVSARDIPGSARLHVLATIAPPKAPEPAAVAAPRRREGSMWKKKS